MKKLSASTKKSWESIFGDIVQKDDVIGVPIRDLNKDGFVDQPYSFSIYSEGNAIFIRSSSGKRYKQASTKTWRASRAVETSSGFAILLQGLHKRDGQFQRWDLDSTGKRENKSRWLTTKKALDSGWEQDFGDVILADHIIGQPIMDSNGDGLVDQSLQLTLFNNNQPIRIKKTMVMELFMTNQAIGMPSKLLNERMASNSLFKAVEKSKESFSLGKLMIVDIFWNDRAGHSLNKQLKMDGIQFST